MDTLFLKVLSNGYVPIIPILAWNYIFASRLPSEFDPKSYDSDVGVVIATGESISRVVIFLMPLIFRIRITNPAGKAGLVVFAVGTVLYFISWLMLIYFPESAWCTTFFGFAAPSYTPLIWLIGLSLMADSYYINVAYSKWHYIWPSTVFTLFHVLHAARVYSRIQLSS